MLLLVVIPTYAMNLTHTDVGIRASQDGSFSNIRNLERFNKMQPYIFPSVGYNDGTSIDPFESYSAYLPINLPSYLIYRRDDSEIESTTSLGSIINLYNFVGDNETASSITLTTPISFVRNNNSTFFFDYQLNINSAGNVSSQKEYWHGESYSIFNSNNNLYGFSVTNPSYASGSNIVYVKGILETVYCVYDNNNVPQYYLSDLHLDNYYLLNTGTTFILNHTLDSRVLDTDYIFAFSRFTGDVLVRYGNSQTEKVIYKEALSLDYSTNITFTDANLGGFTSDEDDYGGSSLSISQVYQQYWSRTLSETVVPGLGTLYINTNGVYNVTDYSTVNVNVSQNVAWSGMFEWLFDSIGAFMDFEIAPGWSTGIIMTIVIGLAIAIWVLKVFLGG